MLEQIKYCVGDTFEIKNIRQTDTHEYEVELFKDRDGEQWSVQLDDLYNVFSELETVFEDVDIVTIDVGHGWYYVTITIFDEEL